MTFTDGISDHVLEPVYGQQHAGGGDDTGHRDRQDLLDGGRHYRRAHHGQSTVALGADGGDNDLQNAGIRRTRKLKTGLYYRLPRFFRVLCIFLFRYIVQLGFLDGVPGLIYHFMYSFMYRFLVDAKLYEAQKTGKYDTTITALEAKD